MRETFLVVLLTFAGCTAQQQGPTRWEQVPGTEGKPAYRIEGADLSDCYRTAAKVCNGRPYVVIDRAPQHPAVSAETSSTTRGGGYHSFVITCR